MCSLGAFPEAQLTLFLSWENGASFTFPMLPPPCMALDKCLSSPFKCQFCLFQCSLPFHQSVCVLYPSVLATGRFEGKVFCCTNDSSIEIQLLPVCAYPVLMTYLASRLKSTDFLGRRLRTRPLLLCSTEIQNPPFLNATISTLKVLIAIFTEFNSEGIGAYSG